uniref:Uncharacterized protein n=1 Tax=Aegilops tauschii subsp. strangulata TaxID=200361 RepID=A0A453JJ13_AEGTS
GTMPILNYMELTGLRSMLIVPAGFQNLTSLQQMVLKDMPVEFRTMVQGQDCTKHIRLILHRLRQ